MKMKSWIKGLCAASLMLSIGLAANAQSSESVLRAASGFPKDHFVNRLGIEPYFKIVSERSKGSIKFDYYPGGQLGKVADYLKLTQAGVMDISFVAPSYVTEKMPLSGVAELPGMFKSACEGTLSYWKALKSSKLGKEDFGVNKVVPLFVWILPPYQIVSRDRAITGLSSFQGLKLRTSGGAMDIMARELGAASVRMSAPEIYESLSRGTLDALVFPLSSIEAYRLSDLIKFSTVGENFGSFVATWSISETKLKSLPKDHQKILLDAGEELVPQLCKEIDNLEMETAEKMKAQGVKMTPLSAEESQKITSTFDKVAKDWADSLDQRRKPGTEVLQAYRAALKEQNGANSAVKGK